MKVHLFVQNMDQALFLFIWYYLWTLTTGESIEGRDIGLLAGCELQGI